MSKPKSLSVKTEAEAKAALCVLCGTWWFRELAMLFLTTVTLNELPPSHKIPILLFPPELTPGPILIGSERALSVSSREQGEGSVFVITCARACEGQRSTSGTLLQVPSSLTFEMEFHHCTSRLTDSTRLGGQVPLASACLHLPCLLSSWLFA